MGEDFCIAVMKFGGTSVGSPENIQRLVEIVRKKIADGFHVVVVVSAASGVTDALKRMARQAASGVIQTDELARLKERLELLGVGNFTNALDRLAHKLQAVFELRDDSAASHDLVVAYGEIISANMISLALEKSGVFGVAMEAGPIGMITDDHYTEARVLPEAYSMLRIALKRILRENQTPVVTGFIGQTLTDHRTTTLGRGASDLSASIIGAAMNAREVEIWTDVPGIMTADPRIVPDAKTIPRITPEEASELAYFGAKVMHPRSIQPAASRHISIRVKNTADPEHEGTLIAECGSSGSVVRGIALKKDAVVVTIRNPDMMDAEGVVLRIAEVFARNRMSIDHIATGQISVSVTVGSQTEHLDAAREELARIGDVSVSAGALVSVVGARLHDDPMIMSRLYAALAREQLRLRLLSMSAEGSSVSMVVHHDGERAVRALHREFFPPR